MKAKGANGVGRFSIEFEVANDRDLMRADEGIISADQVRRMRIKGVVDSGAAGLVLPQTVVKRLGLESIGKVKVRYADRRTATRDEVGHVTLEILGRQGTFKAAVEPRRDTALVGAMVLEDLDLLVDSRNERLIPRDPRIKTYEME